MIYFVLALILGIVLSLDSADILSIPVNGLFPSYFHFLAVGWITQLIMGVVFWMFPKFTQEKPRRSDSLGWFAYVTLNLGLVLRLMGEPALASGQIGWPGILMTAAALLMLAGGSAFVINTWGRVKEK